MSEAYLKKVMLRRILACFALITGLTAVGTPAQAQSLAVMAQAVVEGSQAQPQAPTAACEANQQRANWRSKTASPSPCSQRKPIVIVIPTIQLGSDISRE